MNTIKLQPIESRRKVEAAQDALRNLALKLGAHKKMPTAREICRELKISAVTLDHVLEGLEEQCVIVRRQGSGIYVSPQLYQKSVGLVFGRYAFGPGISPFCSMVVECCQKRAMAYNERFSFYLDIPRDEMADNTPVHADLIDALEKRRLDGMLLVARHGLEQEAWLRQQDVPVVSFSGGVVPPYESCTVGFDLMDMSRNAVRELAARGCRRIAMISSSDAASSTFAPALQENNIPYSSDLLINPVKEAPGTASRMPLGNSAMNRILDFFGTRQRKNSARPDGVIIMDDMLAAGAISATQQRRLIPGDDILIATHANRGSVMLQPYNNSLILLEVDPVVIVEAMFQMLEGMMNHSLLNLNAVTISTRLIVGSAVGSR